METSEVTLTEVQDSLVAKTSDRPTLKLMERLDEAMYFSEKSTLAEYQKTQLRELIVQAFMIITGVR